MKDWCKSFISLLSDDGTERLLSQVREFDLQAACPWFEATPDRDIDLMMASQGHASMLDQDVFEDADGVQVDFDMNDDAVFEEEIIQQADFKHALGMTGLQHIIGNATYHNTFNKA